MIPLTGQMLNTGHLMQPTANATGQSVMITLPSEAAAACTPPSVAWYSPRTRRSHISRHHRASRYVLGSDYPYMKKSPDGSLTICLQNKSPGKDKEANWLSTPAGPLPAPGQDLPMVVQLHLST